jgi:hypothetical protein
MSDTPQSGNDGVDETPKNGESSRAPAHRMPPGAEATFALADEIASDLQVSPDAQVRDIILAHPRVRQQIVAAAVRCLRAEKFYFDRTKKEIVHEEDYATQIKAIAWLAAYSDGLPIQTNLNVNANASGKGRLPPDEMLAQSPAALEAMERALARARAKMQSAQKASEKQALPAPGGT